MKIPMQIGVLATIISIVGVVLALGVAWLVRLWDRWQAERRKRKK